MPFTLQGFAARLQTHDDAAMAQFKSVLLRDSRDAAVPPETLELSSPADVAHFLAVAAVVASQANGKEELKQIRDTHDAGPARDAAYEAFSNACAYLCLQRTPKNEFLLQEGLPVVELDAKKVSSLVVDAKRAFAAMAKLDLAALVSSRAFEEALASRVSHPTKLSAPNGKGGFLKTHSFAIPTDFHSVTEEDFISRETATLSCTAGFQKMWILMLPIVRYQGTEMRLAQLLAQDESLATEVESALKDAGISAADTFVAALRGPASGVLQGEPQVFAGDLPETERLSVLAPYGMFKEVTRAKYAISAAYAAERDERVNALDAQIKEVSDKLAEQPAAATKAEKLVVQARKKELTEELRLLKNERRALASLYLNVPAFSLMFGGAVPRNVAMDLDTSIHTANVLVNVPTVRKQVSAVSPKVFPAKALLRTPKLRFAKLPPYLSADAVGARLTRARVALFGDLISDVMAPLLLAREEWETRAKEMSGATALSFAAQENIYDRNDPYGLFIKGDADLNQKDALVKLRPLIRDISATVKSALVKTCPDMPATYDEELLELVTKFVLLERT
jgi:hypothetical protein